MRNSPTAYKSFSLGTKSAYRNKNLQMDHLAIRIESGETLEDFFGLHDFIGETSYKTIHTANQEVINLTFLFSADLTVDLRRVSHLTDKNFRKTTTRRHPIWFALPQPTIPLTKYQIFAC